jgi:hypothetical protein
MGEQAELLREQEAVILTQFFTSQVAPESSPVYKENITR